LLFCHYNSLNNTRNVLPLDEPFGQLDAQIRYLMEQEIVPIWQQEEKTALFVTNTIDEAIYIGDRIVVLEGMLPGRLHSTYEIDLPRPRDHSDIALLELRRRITDATALTL
jgi:NitT/TauT family transport system ATP-binding protein/sulfonate transport system ATP-binding protein